jgi:hypothetical protein
MRGETIPKSGVTGVTGVTAVSGYVSKSLKLQWLRELRVKNANLENAAREHVTDAVTGLPAPGAVELDEVNGMGAKPPARFSALYETVADYARRLIHYARQDGLALEIKGRRLVIIIGSKSNTDLLGELWKHEAAIIAALELPTWHPRPFPKIEALPPFGTEEPGQRFEKAFRDFCQQCPPGVPFSRWEQAAFDAASLFGMWGTQLTALGFMPGDMLDVPRDGKQVGLAWFMRGSPVMALGKGMAQLQDGRIWRSGKR